MRAVTLGVPGSRFRVAVFVFNVRCSTFCVHVPRTLNPDEPGPWNVEPGTSRSNATGVVVDVNRLEIRVDVQRLRPRFAPAITRLPQAAKRHVRLASVGP